jgi:dihydroflavonol-4-reductase
MKALVTGATGFVGYAVAKKLLSAGYTVKLMARGEVPPHVKELKAEMCQGDLLDEKSLAVALNGCDVVFHVAAHYKLWEKDPQLFYRINVEGSKNLIRLAAERGCRAVYTSSVAAIKPSLNPDKPANEESSATLADMVGHYKRSKFLAEQAVMELAQRGAPVVIVNPSAPIGAYDVKPTPTGKIIVDFLKGKMFGYLHTGLNLVAVEDVAAGHLLAMQKGKPGRRYILGNENLYLKQIFDLLADISKRPSPKLRVPYALAYTAGFFSEILARLAGKEPEIPLDGVRMARKCMFFDSTRASVELGYCPTSVVEALHRAVAWFQEHRYV